MGRVSVAWNQANFKNVENNCVTAKRAEQVWPFHTGLPGYAPTPLVSLPDLAEQIGAAQILVKDESKRFGLNAFKALGASYAIAGYLADLFGLPLDEKTVTALRTEKYAGRIEEMTFVTATDGNHGRGVAWTAKMLGAQAVVYLPKGSAAERLQNILALGAKAAITEYSYDDTVRYAKEKAEENGWVLVQDTAWPGYEDIPAAIMQGYTTLGCEIERQRKEMGAQKPTHLFLQAGVGSMAGAVAGYFASLWGKECPKIVVVEPEAADCLYRTAKADDGRLHVVTGKMDSMMAGLCCGKPCTLAWDILKDTACAFLSCDDSYSAHGMRLLGKPCGADPAVISGESGAVTLGIAAELMTDPALAEIRERLELGRASRILTISTEGDTDRGNYRKILSAK